MATDAASMAQEVADHPVYVGDDHYVYKWNKETKAYDKTDIFVKGEAFSIKKVYASISEMEGDTENAEIKEGDFVLINTSDVENPDNARLYIKVHNTETNVFSYEFLVDMSGAIGFTGKTPQLGIGTVAGGNAAAVSLSEDGTDSAGNPKFKLNFVLPQGEKGDTPILSAGTVTTSAPGTPASAELVPDGATDTGIPCYRLDLTIPEGKQGSGNVSVPPAALKAGVTYLFKPSADGSAEGKFIEYVPAAQEQADWSVADAALPSFIKNKPESMKASGGNADTVGGFGIDRLFNFRGAEVADVATVPGYGYGYTSNGWYDNGPYLIFGTPSSNDNYVSQISTSFHGGSMAFRSYNFGEKTWSAWKRLAISGESQPASDVHLWAKEPNKPSYSMDQITDPEILLVEPGTITRKNFYGSVKNMQGYTTRIALGVKNDSFKFGPGVLSVGINDNATSYFDWYFDPNSARITTSGGDTVAFTADTVEAANKLGFARAINGTYFDGTANIVTSYWGTARTIAFANDVTGAITIDGSQNATALLEVNRITGEYTGNGGAQFPNNIPSGRSKFVMMNQPMRGNISYKDCILLDTYAGEDVPWVNGLAISKDGTLRMYIITGQKNATTWYDEAEVYTTKSFEITDFQRKISYYDLGIDSFVGIDGSYKIYNSVLYTSLATFPALPDPATKNGTEFTVVIFCAGMTTINLPTGANYVNMNGNTINVPRGSLNVEINFLCSGNKWRSTFIIQPD